MIYIDLLGLCHLASFEVDEICDSPSHMLVDETMAEHVISYFLLVFIGNISMHVFLQSHRNFFTSTVLLSVHYYCRVAFVGFCSC
jgi:hypothetical protein